MNNQLRTFLNARNNATVQDDRVVVQDVREDHTAIIMEGHFTEEQCKRKICSWECWRSEQRWQCESSWSSLKPIISTSAKGIATCSRIHKMPKRPRIQHFKDKKLLIECS
ncbi:hypothetical protein Tco_0064715 [Tanacetum coccineum]